MLARRLETCQEAASNPESNHPLGAICALLQEAGVAPALLVMMMPRHLRVVVALPVALSMRMWKKVEAPLIPSVRVRPLEVASRQPEMPPVTKCSVLLQ
jgi:hypothetical protein